MVPNKTEIIEILREGFELYREKRIAEFIEKSDDLSADFSRSDSMTVTIRSFLSDLNEFLNWGYEE